MPLIQGGPPEWIWERRPETLKCEVRASQEADGQTIYELRIQCGLEIVRLQFFTVEELLQLSSALCTGTPSVAGVRCEP